LTQFLEMEESYKHANLSWTCHRTGKDLWCPGFGFLAQPPSFYSKLFSFLNSYSRRSNQTSFGPSVVAHTCNPSYLGSGGQEANLDKKLARPNCNQ
jgi:hypothetical protein